MSNNSNKIKGTTDTDNDKNRSKTIIHVFATKGIRITI